MDSLLIKTLNSQEKSEEIMEKLYHDDANIISMLTVQFKTAQAKSLDFWLHIILSLVQ